MHSRIYKPFLTSRRAIHEMDDADSLLFWTHRHRADYSVSRIFHDFVDRQFKRTTAYVFFHELLAVTRS